MSERSLTARGSRTVDPGQERKLALLHCCSPDAPSRSEQRRAKIVDTARALFAEHGFHGTGIAQIASESGVKVGQLYRDFPAKEAIVAAIVERDLMEFLGESDLRRAIAAGDLAEVRRWIGGFVCGRDREHSRLYPEICAEAARNERVGAIMDGIEQRVRGDLLLALSAFAPDRGEAVAVAADLILTLKIGIANQMTVRPDRDISALCDRVEQLIDAEIEGLRSA